MKRITKESLATAFQITVIIFLFSYSAPSSKNGNGLDTIDTTRVVAADSLYANQQMLTRFGGNNAMTDYYQSKKIPGLLYTQLTMVFNFKETSNTIALNEKNNPNENWLSSTRHPVFLSVK